MCKSRFLLSSFDRAIVAATGLGCGSLFYQAHVDGQIPLKGQIAASICNLEGEQRIHFTPEMCRKLEAEGYLVIDNFLNPKEVYDAIICSEMLDFIKSPNERDGHKVRTDKISFFEKDGSKVCTLGALSKVQSSLNRLSYDIFCSSTFKGFEVNDEFSAKWIGVPSIMQIGLYDSRKDPDDSKIYGSFYDAHFDACSDSFFNLGVLGWLRSSYLRKRYLTAIVYLNPKWTKADGGCLRIFNEDESFVDVEPHGGRLVVFSSVKVMHAVLPTYSKRLACTVWFTLNQ